jgi:peroxiredoxin (alkyl hydroperoxide reductase subunit C)
LAGDYELDEENQLVATGPMISFRGLFLIDKKGVVQHQLINHFTIVRDVKEVLRVVDALKYFEEKGEFCPISK